MCISQFIASFIVGYTTSWQLSLILTAMLPLLDIGGWFMAKAMDQGNASNQAYIDAGAMSQEVLKEIKTVSSFSNFEYEKERYEVFIDTAMKSGIKQGFKAGFGIGFIVFIVYNSYALAVGYGSYLISNVRVNINKGEPFGAGDVITVLFSIIFGCFSLGQSTPYINSILAANNAARGLFVLLSRQPKIDLNNSNLKHEKSSLHGKIIFKNVSFAYPSQPDHFILDNLNFAIEPGQKVAIVGESGSGKSTILSLIERLYDPQEGEILFDDYNIKTFDIEYLRNLIGYVPQMPILLNTSIKENIIFGRKGISEEDIDLAIKNAYAKDFVDQKGLDYNVGAEGKILSGGQKQRIAIARSIVNKPKILIFDEATSALDNKAEKEVQKTLDEVCKGLTSITVAHRITTIKNADKIICLDIGKVIEEGTHKELLARNDFYARLINQYIEQEEVDEEMDIEEDSENSDMVEDEENEISDDREDYVYCFEKNKREIYEENHSHFNPSYNNKKRPDGSLINPSHILINEKKNLINNKKNNSDNISILNKNKKNLSEDYYDYFGEENIIGLNQNELNNQFEKVNNNPYKKNIIEKNNHSKFSINANEKEKDNLHRAFSENINSKKIFADSNKPKIKNKSCDAYNIDEIINYKKKFQEKNSKKELCEIKNTDIVSKKDPEHYVNINFKKKDNCRSNPLLATHIQTTSKTYFNNNKNILSLCSASDNKIERSYSDNC